MYFAGLLIVSSNASASIIKINFQLQLFAMQPLKNSSPQAAVCRGYVKQFHPREWEERFCGHFFLYGYEEERFPASYSVLSGFPRWWCLRNISWCESSVHVNEATLLFAHYHLIRNVSIFWSTNIASWSHLYLVTCGMLDHELRLQLGLRWMRHRKDLFNLKRGWRICVPVDAISGKIMQSLETRYRQLQLPNHSLIARASTKKTLSPGYFPGTKNAWNSTVPHLHYFLIWLNPGPCRIMMHGLCTRRETVAVRTAGWCREHPRTPSS